MVRGVIAAGEWADAKSLTTTPAHPKSLQTMPDQSMIHDSISLLQLVGIRDIIIVATPAGLPHFQQCLGDGEPWGIHLSYAIQPDGGGAIQALVLASEFIADQAVFLAHGNHRLHGDCLPEILQQAATMQKGARIFSHPDSADVLPGFGFYDHTAAARARELTASGCEEITDLNNTYLADGTLEVLEFRDEVIWLDLK